jgi:hypothetical protein
MLLFQASCFNTGRSAVSINPAVADVPNFINKSDNICPPDFLMLTRVSAPPFFVQCTVSDEN